jgi:glycosyltransferase involved in cell wall biosynthesis
MATFNGAKYLVVQLDSIMKELQSKDEVIIVDDCSTDNTLDIIKNYQDKRIKLLVNNTNKGHVFSFSRAINEANNDLIFLSDQDDIWVPGRVSIIKKHLLENEEKVLSSNFNLLKDNKILSPSQKGILQSIDSKKHFKNLIGLYCGNRFYYGCAMAFHRSILNIMLPFPSIVQSHDLWLAIIANVIKTNYHLSAITVTRRIHGSNFSENKRSLFLKIRTRFFFTLLIFIALYRRSKFRLKRIDI